MFFVLRNFLFSYIARVFAMSSSSSSLVPEEASSSPAKPKAGRQRDPVWSLFERDDRNPANVKAVCRGCETVVQGQTSRLHSHAQKCLRLSEKGLSYADLVKKEEEATHAAPGVVSSPSSSFVEPREGQPPLKKLKQGSLPLDRLSAAAKSELQMDVCRFVVGANLPFSVVENGCFRHLLHKVRPGFRPPTRETISGEFLDKLYEEETQKVRLRVRDSPASLALDGWSTNTSPVVGVSFTAGGETHLINTVDATGSPHTGQFLAELATLPFPTPPASPSLDAGWQAAGLVPATLLSCRSGGPGLTSKGGLPALRLGNPLRAEPPRWRARGHLGSGNIFSYWVFAFLLLVLLSFPMNFTLCSTLLCSPGYFFYT